MSPDDLPGAGLIKPESFEAGVQDLNRTTEADGVFCYTFFKGVGRTTVFSGTKAGLRLEPRIGDSVPWHIYSTRVALRAWPRMGILF